jgi:DNA-3-methyladenine glycosylase II
MSSVFSIPVQSPYAWKSILAYLPYRRTPGVETIQGERYVRTLPAGAISVEYDASAPCLRCSVEGAGEAAALLPRIERLFDTRHDPRPVARVLERCPLLAARVRKAPGLRAPGCWEPFELCLRVILGQQVSVKGAHTLMGRLVDRCPGLDPVRLSETDLSTIGLPGARLRSVRAFAERVAAGAIRLDAPSWEEIASGLRATPGFGPWTLAYLAIRLGRDADAFPESDLGLLRATGSPSPRELLRLAEAWRPYRGYAAMYLWSSGPGE